MSRSKKSQKSFTVLELLVVISIIILLTAIFLISYKKGQRQLALQRATYKLAQDIRRVQAMAGLEEEECSYSNYQYGYGIYFNSGEKGKYILFADCYGDGIYNSSGDKTIETVNLERGIYLSSSVSRSIVFTPPDPFVTINPSEDTAGITLINDNSQTETVVVNKAGLIDIE